jgi:hypothetical protein
VDIETQRQISELEERRTAHRDRLQVLEVQAARMGRNAPPEVVVEIHDIKTKLVPIDAAIFKLTYVGTVRADVPGNDRGDAVSMAVERTLERHRRAVVASQTDQVMFLDIRLDAALREVRIALVAVAALSVISLLLSSGMLVYLVTR